jgi:hypothetical protein
MLPERAFGLRHRVLHHRAGRDADGLLRRNGRAQRSGPRGRIWRLRAVPAMSAAGLAQMLEATPDQRPERIAEAVVALLDMPFGKKPFRTVVDHTGVGPQIERYNDVLHDVTRTVLTNFGIAQMLDLNA